MGVQSFDFNHPNNVLIEGLQDGAPHRHRRRLEGVDPEDRRRRPLRRPRGADRRYRRRRRRPKSLRASAPLVAPARRLVGEEIGAQRRPAHAAPSDPRDALVGQGARPAVYLRAEVEDLECEVRGRRPRDPLAHSPRELLPALRAADDPPPPGTAAPAAEGSGSSSGGGVGRLQQQRELGVAPARHAEARRRYPRRALLRAAAEPRGELDAGRLRLHALRRPPADSGGCLYRWCDLRATTIDTAALLATRASPAARRERCARARSASVCGGEAPSHRKRRHRLGGGLTRALLGGGEFAHALLDPSNAAGGLLEVRDPRRRRVKGEPSGRRHRRDHRPRRVSRNDAAVGGTATAGGARLAGSKRRESLPSVRWESRSESACRQPRVVIRDRRAGALSMNDASTSGGVALQPPDVAFVSSWPPAATTSARRPDESDGHLAQCPDSEARHRRRL